MGTRSNVRLSENGRPIFTLYRQFDGYPSGMGQDIVDAIGSARLTNGFGMEDEIPHTFNGLNCMAAYLIGALKGDTIGNVYLYPSDHEPGSAGEEYLYDIYLAKSGEHEGKLCMEVTSLGWAARPESDFWTPDMVIYNGPVADFDPTEVEKVANELYEKVRG